MGFSQKETKKELPVHPLPEKIARNDMECGLITAQPAIISDIKTHEIAITKSRMFTSSSEPRTRCQWEAETIGNFMTNASFCNSSQSFFDLISCGSSVFLKAYHSVLSCATEPVSLREFSHPYFIFTSCLIYYQHDVIRNARFRKST